MALRWLKRISFAGIAAVGVVWLIGATATPAAAQYYSMKCDRGYKLQKQSNTNKYRCTKQRGTKAIYKQGKCFVPTPYLKKFKYLGSNFACGVQVGATQIWNKFRCPRGYTRILKASIARKTCGKRVPRYSFRKPTF
jgi:hypothetical protein